jgi:hypothetical protein
MNPYAILSSGIGTTEATSLSARLAAWHDEMVAHERRLRSGTTTDVCDDECPHMEARTLWAEAFETFGTRANELAFLRSRALTDAGKDEATARREASPRRADAKRRSGRVSTQTIAHRPRPFARSSKHHPTASAEL